MTASELQTVALSELAASLKATIKALAPALEAAMVRSGVLPPDAAAITKFVIRRSLSVLSAVEEVENALTSFTQESKRRAVLQRSTDESERSVKLVRELYANGLTDFQNVLDMQRTLWTQQDRLAASRGQVVLNLIRIYKAVGGGWPLDRPEPDNLTEKPAESEQR